MAAATLLALSLRQEQKPPVTSSPLRVASIAPCLAPTQSPALLFHDNFSQPPKTGPNAYFEYDRANGSFAWTANEDCSGDGSKGAMQCLFEKGQVSAGNLKMLFGRAPVGKGVRPQETFRELYWRVYVKHEAGWEGSPAKLARATCLTGSDWSQGMIAHVWSGKGDTLCIDPATGIRNNSKITTKYNDFDHLHWLGLRNAQTPLFRADESGRWVCIESHIRLNTPGKSDGVFTLWIDGKEEASRTDLNWHGTWGDYGINAVFLENYWNQGAVKREARWFDEFVVSTKPIGPLVTSAAPTITRTVAADPATWQAQIAADPEGHNIVWVSSEIAATQTMLPLDKSQGAFSGSLAGKKQFDPIRIYWVRLRSRPQTGRSSTATPWTGWTSWHAPFRVSAPVSETPQRS